MGAMTSSGTPTRPGPHSHSVWSVVCDVWCVVRTRRRRCRAVLHEGAEGCHPCAGPHHEQRHLLRGRQAQGAALRPHRHPHLGLQAAQGGAGGQGAVTAARCVLACGSLLTAASQITAGLERSPAIEHEGPPHLTTTT